MTLPDAPNGRVLFVFGHALQFGGHMFSAMAMAKYLCRNGTSILVACPASRPEFQKAYENVGAEIAIIPSLAPTGRWINHAGISPLLDVAQQMDVSRIHAQDYLGLESAAPVAAKLQKPLVYTQAGGEMMPDPLPKTLQVVVFSKELQDGFQKAHRIPADRLHLVAARIDLEQYVPQPSAPEFSRKHDIPEDAFCFVAAMRLAKTAWLRTIFAAAEGLAKEAIPACILVAGGGENLQDVTEQANELNARAERTVLRFLGPLYGPDAMTMLYRRADALMGTGRGILEAMAMGKPACILGETGEGELLEPGTIEPAAYYNFSGRHFRFQESLFSLADSLGRLLHEPNLRTTLSTFSKTYVSENLSAVRGAEALQRVYAQADRSVPTPGEIRRWRWRSNAFRLFRGIRRRIVR